MPYPIFALSPLPISCTDYRLYFAAGMGAAEEPLVENTSMPGTQEAVLEETSQSIDSEAVETGEQSP
jgi:hypothetical protein